MTTDDSNAGRVPDDLDRYREGDRSAFLRLWGQERDDFFFWLRRKVPSHADDLLGDLAVKLLLPVVHAKYDRKKPWGAWAFTILRNLTTDFLRRRACGEAAALGAALLLDTESGVSDDGLAEDLDACLHGLPEGFCELLIQCHLEGKQQVEIAVEWAISAATVSKRLDKARTLLADCLKGKGHGDKLR